MPKNGSTGSAAPAGSGWPVRTNGAFTESAPWSLLAAVAPCLNPTCITEWGGRALAPEPLNLAPASIAEQGGGVWCAAWLVSRRRSLLRVALDPKSRPLRSGEVGRLRQ